MVDNVAVGPLEWCSCVFTTCYSSHVSLLLLSPGTGIHVGHERDALLLLLLLLLILLLILLILLLLPTTTTTTATTATAATGIHVGHERDALVLQFDICSFTEFSQVLLRSSSNLLVMISMSYQ